MRQTDFFNILFDSQNFEFQFLTDAEYRFGIFDSVIRKFGNMTQTFEIVRQFDKNTESGKARNFSFDDIARFVRRDKRFPRARRQFFN